MSKVLKLRSPNYHSLILQKPGLEVLYLAALSQQRFSAADIVQISILLLFTSLKL